VKKLHHDLQVPRREENPLGRARAARGPQGGDPFDVPLGHADEALGARGNIGGGTSGDTLQVVPAPDAVDIEVRRVSA
jgi:hypothetical protein